MNDRDEVINSAINRGIDNTDPMWTWVYNVLASILLKQQLYVAGDDIKAFCITRGLWEPDCAQRWTGAPLTLERAGLIEPLMFIRPCQPHNHMREVRFYKSNLFDLNNWKVKNVQTITCD